jgi:hypothetical protein
LFELCPSRPPDLPSPCPANPDHGVAGLWWPIPCRTWKKVVRILLWGVWVGGALEDKAGGLGGGRPPAMDLGAGAPQDKAGGRQPPRCPFTQLRTSSKITTMLGPAARTTPHPHPPVSGLATKHVWLEQRCNAYSNRARLFLLHRCAAVPPPSKRPASRGAVQG